MRTDGRNAQFCQIKKILDPMKPIVIGIFSFAVVFCGCTGNPQARIFKEDGNNLRYALSCWNSRGRPTNFKLDEVLGPPSDFFIYTNVVRSTNGDFHCRFAARSFAYPPGILVITDDGQLIFICSTNGKVTVSPDKHWP